MSQTLTTEQIAQAAHEVNRLWCQLVGDDSQVKWSEAPEWQKKSFIDGVLYHVGSFTLPRDSHANWLRTKEADGWKYGPVKDAEKKEHPCMVPFDELPIEQQVKDYMFWAICHACEVINKEG